jgi:hypothetical protein
MGRYINCEVNGESETVYKYVLGVQISEMHRISTELRIGEYHLIRYTYNEDDENEEEDTQKPAYEYVDEQSDDVDGDILILRRSDIEKLNESIDILEANLASDQKDEEDGFYIAMIKAIRYFMIRYLNQEKFIFVGEF